MIERRKELIPRIISERKKGNKTILIRNKLYVNNKLTDKGSREGHGVSILSWNVEGLKVL